MKIIHINVEHFPVLLFKLTKILIKMKRNLLIILTKGERMNEIK